MTSGGMAAQSGALPAGTRLNGIYELGEKIASGGMGDVYVGINIHTGDRVAIKLVRPDFVESDLALAMMRKEAAALDTLFHEAIVRYYLFSLDPVLARPYLVMEFVEGRSLKDMLKDGPLSIEATCKLARRIGEGLSAAHARGIVHRDVSPDNIILAGDDPEHAKIIDFGIARHSGGVLGTVVGDGFAGKYGYVSPEQVGLFGGDVDARSDIWSLGLVLAEAATGLSRNMNGSALEIVEKRRRLPDLFDVSPRLRPVLARMLAPDPADRVADLREILAEFDMADDATRVAPRSVGKTPPSSPDTADRPDVPPIAAPPSDRPSDGTAAAPPTRPPSPEPMPMWSVPSDVIAATPSLSPPVPRGPRTAVLAVAAVAAVVVVLSGAGLWMFLRNDGRPPSAPPPLASPVNAPVAVPLASKRAPIATTVDTDPPGQARRTAAGGERVGEVSRDDDVAAFRVADPTDGDVARFLAAYPKNNCTLLVPERTEIGAARVEAFGASTRPFEVLDGDFLRAFGFPLEIRLHLVMPGHCPLIDRLATMAGKPPLLDIAREAVADGRELTGTATGEVGRNVAVFLVEDDASARTVATGRGRVPFRAALERRTRGGDKPQIVVATTGAGAAANGGARPSLAALLDALAEPGAGAAIRYVVVTR